LGCRVGIVTSSGTDFDLTHVVDGALVTHFPAATTTTFENIYTPDSRRQVLHTVAEKLSPEMVPSDWRASIIHVGPVARECDPAMVNALGNGFVGVTPQGWMRCWDQDGHVSGCRWENAAPWLARADGVVLSEDDVAGDDSLLAQYATKTQVLVVTQGAAGCTVHTHGQSRHFPAPAAREVDSTGAGDIFAAAFFVWLQRSGQAWTAARFANCIAAHSVTRAGLAGTPTPDEVTRCERNSKQGLTKRET
jgi:sugar/nucleoside kinase (ribokinase family)